MTVWTPSAGQVFTSELIVQSAVPSLHTEVVKVNVVLWIMVKIKIVVLIFNTAPQRQTACSISLKMVRDQRVICSREEAGGDSCACTCTLHVALNDSYWVHTRGFQRGSVCQDPTVCCYLSGGSGWIFLLQGALLPTAAGAPQPATASPRAPAKPISKEAADRTFIPSSLSVFSRL